MVVIVTLLQINVIIILITILSDILDLKQSKFSVASKQKSSKIKRLADRM